MTSAAMKTAHVEGGYGGDDDDVDVGIRNRSLRHCKPPQKPLSRKDIYDNDQRTEYMDWAVNRRRTEQNQKWRAGSIDTPDRSPKQDAVCRSPRSAEDNTSNKNIAQTPNSFRREEGDQTNTMKASYEDTVGDNNEGASMDIEDSLESLLTDTEPEDWRRPLREIIGAYIIEKPLKDALVFMQQMVEDAICSKQKQPEKKHRIRIHLDKKPTIFHSAEWCKMMRGLGFITEDTGTTNKIEMCQLFVPPTVPVSVLTGFYSLLESLVDLDINYIRVMINLNSEHAVFLKQVIQEARQPGTDLSTYVRPLWDSYRDLMEWLGYNRVKESGRKYFVFTQETKSPRLRTVYIAIHALHGTVTDMQETLV